MQVAKEYLSRLREPAVQARLKAGAAAGPLPLDGAQLHFRLEWHELACRNT